MSRPSTRRLILAAASIPLSLVLLAGCASQQDAKVESPATPTEEASAVHAFVRTGQLLEIRRNDVDVTITADGGDVEITGSGLAVQVNGNVEDLTINGSNNTMASKDSTWLEVSGDRNKLTGETVSQTVRIEGVRNNVTFTGAPYVRVRGTHNVVNGVAQ